MYRSSSEQLFSKVARIRARAQVLLSGNAGEPSLEAGDVEEDRRLEAMALASRIELRLPRLVAAFGLPVLAQDAIACLVATEFDPLMRTLVRALQRELGRPWLEIGTIAELLALPVERVPELAALFASSGPLRRFALATIDDSVEAPAVATRVKLAARVARHLVDDDELPPWMKLVKPEPRLQRSLADPAAVGALVRRMRRANEGGEPLVVELTGARGVGRRFLAEGLAHELGAPLLSCDLTLVERSELPERLAEARREARLHEALPCLADWDVHLPAPAPPAGNESDAPPVTPPRRLPPGLAEHLDTLEGIVVLTGEEREPLLERPARDVIHLEVPFPSPSQRATLAAETLARLGARPAADADLLALSRRYALDPARIEAFARAAVELSREHAAERDDGDGGGEGADAHEVSHAELNEACRRQLHHDLKSLAVRVTASHRWEDLVVPVDVYHGLREMIAYVRHGQKVYEEWGFGARHSLAQGVSALFAGPPGTGKTMCASVMARELDMELFRVDLSRIVSKWIGETEKNLAKVFDEAQRSNAIILFDEADSLFARRTDVKSSVDRYANLEVNFLLQRMEGFGGITILTTNFEDTIDSAFKRRLTFRLHFEKPDAGARAALWRKVFPAGCALAPDIDFDEIAALFEMSGGNIRNAAVRAAFLAATEGQPVDMGVLLLAAERESREMGLLTRSAPTPRPAVVEPAPDDEPPPPTRLRPLRGPRPPGS